MHVSPANLFPLDIAPPDAQVKRNAAKLGMNVAMPTDYCTRPSASSIHQAVVNYTGIDAAYMPRAAATLAQAFQLNRRLELPFPCRYRYVLP